MQLPDISKEIGVVMKHYFEYTKSLYPNVGDYTIKKYAEEFLEAWLNLQKDKATDVFSELNR